MKWRGQDVDIEKCPEQIRTAYKESEVMNKLWKEAALKAKQAEYASKQSTIYLCNLLDEHLTLKNKVESKS